MNTYPFAGEIKMTKVIKDGKEVIEWERVDLTYHADGNVGIGTPPDASAPVMGEPVERLRVSLTDGAQEERNKLAAWMMRQGFATGHGDTTEDLLKELDWQIDERIAAEREACAAVCDVLAVHPEYASDITKVAAQAIRARGDKS